MVHISQIDPSFIIWTIGIKFQWFSRDFSLLNIGIHRCCVHIFWFQFVVLGIGVGFGKVNYMAHHGKRT